MRHLVKFCGCLIFAFGSVSFPFVLICWCDFVAWQLNDTVRLVLIQSKSHNDGGQTVRGVSMVVHGNADIFPGVSKA